MKIYFYGISDHHVVPGLSFSEPTRTYKRAIEHSPKPRVDNFSLCPAFRDSLKNVFDLRFPFTYVLKNLRDMSKISSSFYDQEFFDKMVWLRDPVKRSMNLNIHYFFITEEPLLIETMPAPLCDNDFVNKTMYINGKFDTGKWPRPLNASFIVKKDVDEIKINSNDVYSSIKFYTDETIEFVKFRPDNEILDIMHDYHSIRHFKGDSVWNLNQYYDMFKKMKVKKYLLKKIKENILEE